MTSPVSITNHFKSSARINDEHFDAGIFLENFICHGTVQQTLSNLCAEVSGSAQRAFTLTGPYGSGKSTLALYLDCLLSSTKRTRQSALKKLAVEQVAADRLKSRPSPIKRVGVLLNIFATWAPRPLLSLKR